MDQIATSDSPPPLRGRALRFVLVDELMRHEEMTVAELVTALVHRTGYDLGGRASKIISDALRWETRRGRVVRLGRGRYRFSHAARSTTRRIKLLAARSRAWVVAIMRRPTDEGAPYPAAAGPFGPGQPPWADLTWVRNS